MTYLKEKPLVMMLAVYVWIQHQIILIVTDLVDKTIFHRTVHGTLPTNSKGENPRNFRCLIKKTKKEHLYKNKEAKIIVLQFLIADIKGHFGWSTTKLKNSGTTCKIICSAFGIFLSISQPSSTYTDITRIKIHHLLHNQHYINFVVKLLQHFQT